MMRRLTSSSSRAASCFWCLRSAAFSAQVAGSKWQSQSFFYGFRSDVGQFLWNSETCYLFVLQWHRVLLSAGAFGGEAAHK